MQVTILKANNLYKVVFHVLLFINNINFKHIYLTQRCYSNRYKP